MKLSNILILSALIVIVVLSGCIVTKPDMKLQKYSEPIISMQLNHAKTTSFCQANGYDTSEQWIIGEVHSGMYGQKVGYNLWGMDGSFNANDARVHVDCNGKGTEETVFTNEDVNKWLETVDINVNGRFLSNTTYDQFCQQQNMNFKEKNNNTVLCRRSFDVSKEYTPQEIARWYIYRDIAKNN